MRVGGSLSRSSGLDPGLVWSSGDGTAAGEAVENDGASIVDVEIVAFSPSKSTKESAIRDSWGGPLVAGTFVGCGVWTGERFDRRRDQYEKTMASCYSDHLHCMARVVYSLRRCRSIAFCSKSRWSVWFQACCGGEINL